MKNIIIFAVAIILCSCNNKLETSFEVSTANNNYVVTLVTTATISSTDLENIKQEVIYLDRDNLSVNHMANAVISTLNHRSKFIRVSVSNGQEEASARHLGYQIINYIGAIIALAIIAYIIIDILK